jgi:hypothetical protein
MLAVALVVLAAALGFSWWVLQRPQRGALILAVGAPLNGLLLIAPLPAIAERWKEGIVVLMAAGAVVTRRTITRAPAPWATALLAFLALSVAHALIQANATALAALKIGFFYSLALFAIWRCPMTRLDRDRLVTALMSVGILCAVVGLAQQIVGEAVLNQIGYEYNATIRTSGGYLRSFSTFNQPFPFGLYMALVLLVCTPVAVYDPRRLRNRIFLWCAPLLLIGMAASIVRGAFLAVVVGAMYLASRWRRQLIHGAIIAAVCVLALLPTGFANSAFSASSLGDRTEGWTAGLPYMREKPLGHGIGTAGAAAEKGEELAGTDLDVDIGGRVSVVPDGPFPYQPDNYYVKTAYELGPVGLWIFLVFLWGVFLSARRITKATEGEDHALAMGITAHIVGLAAASLVATYFEVFPMDLFFWILLGVLGSLWIDSSSTRSRSDPPEAVSRPTSESSSTPSLV